MRLKRYRGVTVAILSLFLVGCQNKITKDTSGAQTYIYYLNEEKTEMKTQPFEIKETNTQKAINLMINKLQKQTGEVDLNPAIPKGVKVLGCQWEDGQVTIDLSEEYEKIEPVVQALSRAAIVDSLTQIQGVDHVYFLVEGKPMTDRNGNEIGILNSKSFVQNIGSTVNSYQTATLHLYFSNESGERLQIETKDVKYSSNISLEKLILEQLLKGPSGVGKYRTIRPDIIILGVTVRDEICYVNLDEAFLQNQYDIKPEITIYSIVNSLVDGTPIKAVQISVNGDTNVKYMGIVDLSKPLEARMDYLMEE